MKTWKPILSILRPVYTLRGFYFSLNFPSSQNPPLSRVSSQFMEDRIIQWRIMGVQLCTRSLPLPLPPSCPSVNEDSWGHPSCQCIKGGISRRPSLVDKSSLHSIARLSILYTDTQTQSSYTIIMTSKQSSPLPGLTTGVLTLLLLSCLVAITSSAPNRGGNNCPCLRPLHSNDIGVFLRRVVLPFTLEHTDISSEVRDCLHLLVNLYVVYIVGGEHDIQKPGLPSC